MVASLSRWLVFCAGTIQSFSLNVYNPDGMKRFDTIIIGAGREAERMAAALATSSASCGLAVPSELMTFEWENLAARLNGQTDPPPIQLPSSTVRAEGAVSFDGPHAVSVGVERWESPRII